MSGHPNEGQCVASSECRAANVGEYCVPSDPGVFPEFSPYACAPPYSCIDGVCGCSMPCYRPCGERVECSMANCCSGEQVCREGPEQSRCVSGYASIPLASSSAADERQPTLSADGLQLVFSRKLPADRGQLWESWLIEGRWSLPHQIAALHDGAARDVSPALGPDALSLVFSSDRVASGARGGLDVFLASRAARFSRWLVLRHLPELSSACDDFARLTSDGLHAVVLHSCGRGSGQATSELVLARRLAGTDPDRGFETPLPLDPWLVLPRGLETVWLSADLRQLLLAAPVDPTDASSPLALWEARRLEAQDRFGVPTLLLQAKDRIEALSDPWISNHKLYVSERKAGQWDLGLPIPLR